MRLTSTALEDRLEKARDLESRLTFRLSVISKLLDQQAAELLRGTPLSLTAYRIMTIIDTFGEISISDISRTNAIDRAQVSRVTVDLERKRLIEFRGDPGSRRKKLAALTAAGRALLDQARPRLHDRQRRLEEGLGPKTREALLTALTRLEHLLSD